SCTATFTAGTTAGTANLVGAYSPSTADTAHSGSTSAAFAITVQAQQAHATTTTVSCNPASITVLQQSVCTATVKDTTTTPTTPTGTVSFTVSGTATGGFGTTSPCTLAQGTNPVGTASCSATFTPSSTGTANIVGMYSGDATPSPAASYSFQAKYSGDGNNNPATSACELFNITDFTITTSTTSVTVNVGATSTVTITVAPINGFTGTVTLTTNPSAGLTATVSPGSISGGSGTAILSVSSNSAGNYTVFVNGTSGPDSHNTQMIMVQVVDFQISATTPVNTTPNVAGSSTVTIKAINGFTGTVSLTSSDTTH